MESTVWICLEGETKSRICDLDLFWMDRKGKREPPEGNGVHSFEKHQNYRAELVPTLPVSGTHFAPVTPCGLVGIGTTLDSSRRPGGE